MAVNRRQFLFGAGGLAAAAATMGLTACAPGSGGGGSTGGNAGGAVDLKFAWWGNELRNKNTQASIDAYIKANPNVKIAAQPGEFGSYWDKLATQTAGGQAPDIIQMDMNYISEYGTRQALLDLSKVDVSKFSEGTVDSGKINDQLVGINAGVNSADHLRQSGDLREGQDGCARRHDLDVGLDDRDRGRGGGRQGGRAVRCGVGVRASDALFSAFVRQNGRELFSADAVTFEPGDAQAWFDLMVKAQKAKAIGSPQQISEEGSPKPLDQSAVVVGQGRHAGLQLQPAARGHQGRRDRDLDPAVPEPDRQGDRPQGLVQGLAVVLRPRPRPRTPTPSSRSSTGTSTPPSRPTSTWRSAVFRATPRFWRRSRRSWTRRIRRSSSTSRTSSPRSPTPRSPRRPAAARRSPPPCTRYATDVLFGRASTADAAQKFVDEMKSNLQN